MAHSSVPDADLVALLGDGGATWRHSALVAALVHIHGVSPRSARRAVANALGRGIIARVGVFYSTAEAISTAPEAISTGPQDGIGSAGPNQQSALSVVECESLVQSSTHRYRRVDRRDLLECLRGRGWRYSELILTICSRYGCAESTARRNVSLALQSQYLARGVAGYHVTSAAESGLREFGRLDGLEGMRFARFCSGRPGLGMAERAPIPARDVAASTGLVPMRLPSTSLRRRTGSTGA
jgi:hypothetical protein